MILYRIVGNADNTSPIAQRRRPWRGFWIFFTLALLLGLNIWAVFSWLLGWVPFWGGPWGKDTVVSILGILSALLAFYFAITIIQISSRNHHRKSSAIIALIVSTLVLLHNLLFYGFALLLVIGRYF